MIVEELQLVVLVSGNFDVVLVEEERRTITGGNIEGKLDDNESADDDVVVCDMERLLGCDGVTKAAALLSSHTDDVVVIANGKVLLITSDVCCSEIILDGVVGVN